MKSTLRLLVIVLTVVFAAGFGAGPALAQPDAGSVTYDWRRLGLSSAVTFSAANSAQTVSFPVPNGLTPQTMQGVLQAATNVGGGYLEAQDTDGRTLGTVPLPNVSAAEASVPFTLNIASVPVRDRMASVRLVVRETRYDEICNPPLNVSVGEIAISYGGSIPAPTTLQQYFPAVPPVIDIYVDPSPTTAESQAVLDLVTALAAHYRPARTQITVRELSPSAAPPVSADPLTRSVVVREADQSALTVVPQGPGAYLEITAPADALATQVALVRDNLLAIAQTRSARVDSASEVPLSGSHTMKFADLDVPKTVTVFGESTVFIGLDAAQFKQGQPGPIDIHLLAMHTPIQPAEKATLTVRSLGRALATQELGESGTVDLDFTIPSSVADRNAGLDLTLTYQPQPGACNPRTAPMSFDIDPTSTATARSDDSVEMGGFAALPLGFAPTFQVGLDEADNSALSHAADLIELIQQQTPTELQPTVVSVDQAAGSNIGALIIAPGDAVHDQELNPPIDTVDAQTAVDVPPNVQAEIPGGLATVQAYDQNGRTVLLVSTSGEWALADPLFDYLAALPTGWSDLDGDVIASGVGASPQVLTIRTNGPEGPEEDDDDWKVWALISAGAAIVATAGAAAVLAIRRRQHSR